MKLFCCGNTCRISIEFFVIKQEVKFSMRNDDIENKYFSVSLIMDLNKCSHKDNILFLIKYISHTSSTLLQHSEIDCFWTPLIAIKKLLVSFYNIYNTNVLSLRFSSKFGRNSILTYFSTLIQMSTMIFIPENKLYVFFSLQHLKNNSKIYMGNNTRLPHAWLFFFLSSHQHFSVINF